VACRARNCIIQCSEIVESLWEPLPNPTFFPHKRCWMGLRASKSGRLCVRKWRPLSQHFLALKILDPCSVSFYYITTPFSISLCCGFISFLTSQLLNSYFLLAFTCAQRYCCTLVKHPATTMPFLITSTKGPYTFIMSILCLLLQSHVKSFRHTSKLASITNINTTT
jgi:hypothetical protein